MDNEYYRQSIKDVFEELKTDEKGLKEIEVKRRIKQHGLNEITQEDGVRPIALFFNQFKSIMIIILIIAMSISFLLGEIIDGVAILIIIVLNALLGFFQEYKAEKTLQELNQLTKSTATVIREGEKKIIPSTQLTIGDIVYLEEGMKVPADIRLFQANELFIDESILTGESESVLKHVSIIEKKVSIGDRKNMVFMSTLIVRGTGLGVVVGVGEKTQVGKISKLVKEAKEPKTPLQEKLDDLSKQLALIVIILGSLIVMLGVFGKISFTEIFLVAISLAVSAIPEGLPAVVTVTLALGVKDLAGKKALVRKLSAAETLGSTNIILTDKTGTITRNEMTVRVVKTIENTYFVTGLGLQERGDFLVDGKKANVKNDKVLNKLATSALLNNNASIVKEGDEKKVIGDQTESSLIILSRKLNLKKEELEKEYTFIDEHPFNSESKRMSKIYRRDKKHFLFVKGAPEKIIKDIKTVLTSKGEKQLTNEQKERILKQVDELAKKALRVLLIAYKKSSKLEDLEKENNLTYLGIVGIIDPPRKGVKTSILEAKKAGVRTVMITGDHALTAKAIAREVGILSGQDEIAITGEELNKMQFEALVEKIKTVNVFARVSPEHKVKILKAFQENPNNTVAMTGDGVNDAPALKSADIGISMGLKGTEVAKSASKMILLDDNYSTIVSAIRGGRVIYDNITKFIRFLLSANFSELIVVTVSVIAGMPIPYIPVQLLFLNLVTDGFPALALGVDPEEKGIMNRPPRKRKETMLKRMTIYAIVASIVASIISFHLFYKYLQIDLNLARTMTFTSSVVFELILVFSARSDRFSLNPKRMFENKRLIQAVILSFFLQALAVYSPIGQTVFKTIPLNTSLLLELFSLNLIGVIIVEALKPWLIRKD